jgi:hypothetical protein
VFSFVRPRQISTVLIKRIQSANKAKEAESSDKPDLRRDIAPASAAGTEKIGLANHHNPRMDGKKNIGVLTSRTPNPTFRTNNPAPNLKIGDTG